MNRTRQVDPRIAFGMAIRRLRQLKGVSQDELASAANLNRSYVGDVERGVRNISLLNMTKLSAALGVPLSEVVIGMEKQGDDATRTE